MSHTIYNVSAIILHNKTQGEYDSVYWLLTDELGILIAGATGVHKPGSKMRAHLQLYNVVRISLVRGKYKWRITGVEPKEDIIHVNDVRYNIKCFEALARIFSFIRRMTVVDTPIIERLFDTTMQAREQLLTLCDESKVYDLEVRIMAKILHLLGYIDTITIDKIQQSIISTRELTQIVNKALQDSHM